jgi:hypothetical protein
MFGVRYLFNILGERDHLGRQVQARCLRSSISPPLVEMIRRALRLFLMSVKELYHIRIRSA